MPAKPRDRPRGRYVKNPGKRLDQTRRDVDDRLRETAILTRAGYAASDIALRLGVDQRTVIRYRRRLRDQQQYQLAS